MPQPTNIQLTWQTIKYVIDNSPSGPIPQPIRQLDDLVKNQQANQADDSALNNKQLFKVAQILFKNGRDINKRFEPILRAMGKHQLRALHELNQATHWNSDGLLNLANFEAVAGHSEPLAVANAIKALNEAGLLEGDNAQANRDAVAEHIDPEDIAHALKILSRAQLLQGDKAQTNFEAVVQYSAPDSKRVGAANNIVEKLARERLADALEEFNRLGLLQGDNAQTNFEAIASHRKPVMVANALAELHRNGLIQDDNAQTYFEALAGHSDPWILVDALKDFYDAGLLGGNDAQAYRDAITGHSDPNDVVNAVTRLRRLDLLPDNNGQSYLETVAGHNKPESIACILEELNEAGLLQGDTAQANFNALMDPVHQWLTCEEAIQNIWASIPNHLLTQQNFNNLLQCARQEQPEVTTRRYVNRLLYNDPQQAQQVVNNEQSTHTASVHTSVRDSAKRLYERYQSTLNNQKAFDNTWYQISQWLNNLKQQYPNDNLVQAANRAWPRYYDHHFVEQGSQVSMQQIIVCFWQGIHDPDNQQLADVQDGKQALLQALYDNQRTYNLDAQGNDDGDLDKPGCTGGQFNKFIEQLVASHPDAEIVFITPALASEILPKVIKAIIQEQKLETEIQQNGVEQVWPSIHQQVLERMRQKFEVENGLTENQIQEIVAEGQYLDLDLLGLSPEQQSSQAQQLGRQGLFSTSANQNTHDAEAENENTNNPRQQPNN